MPDHPGPRVRGRGASANPTGRFERLTIEPDPDALPPQDEIGVPTQFFRDDSRTVISRNDSPDIPYTHSLNPYRGCEHGCIYCYARPYHEYLGLSAGLDFETKLLVKEDAPDCLVRELGARTWSADPLALSGVTDPYQPVERRLEITRRCLEVAVDCRQPVEIITKSALAARDVDLLSDLARHRAASVSLTITTLDEALRRSLEPRTSTADGRFDAVSRLSAAGVPVGVMVAPVIPGLTDHEIPRILRRAREAGASWAAYTMLRLPHGVASMFEAWLDRHVPAQREKVLGRLRDVRSGKLSDACFGTRMRGEGPLADLAEGLFHAARERNHLAAAAPPLSGAAFRRPARTGRLFE